MKKVYIVQGPDIERESNNPSRGGRGRRDGYYAPSKSGVLECPGKTILEWISDSRINGYKVTVCETIAEAKAMIIIDQLEESLSDCLCVIRGTKGDDPDECDAIARNADRALLDATRFVPRSALG